MNILIPAEGLGSRFAAHGTPQPKPLIDVRGKPMIERVVENLSPCYAGHFYFIIRKEHVEKYWWYPKLLQTIAPGSYVHLSDAPLRGPATSCLQMEEFVPRFEPLLIADCDQILEWSPYNFLLWMKETEPDGCILTWTSTNPKSSYALLNADGFVARTAEKEVISNRACCGLYYWKRAYDFFNCTKAVVERGETSRGEYFVAPIYNEFIRRGAKVTAYHIGHHWPIGTPEDLSIFLQEENLDKRIR